MASLWQKKNGTWCITYREEGKQKVRSLRTKDKREALRLKCSVETMLDEQGAVALHVSDKPKPKPIDAELDEFWEKFRDWARSNRAQTKVEEYAVWFNQLKEFTSTNYTQNPVAFQKP